MKYNIISSRVYIKSVITSLLPIWLTGTMISSRLHIVEITGLFRNRMLVEKAAEYFQHTHLKSKHTNNKNRMIIMKWNFFFNFSRDGKNINALYAMQSWEHTTVQRHVCWARQELTVWEIIPPFKRGKSDIKTFCFQRALKVNILTWFKMQNDTTISRLLFVFCW